MRRPVMLAAVMLAAVLAPQLGSTHAERPTPSPARPGNVPDANRTPAHIVNVCKLAECAYDDIQDAVLAIDAIRGATSDDNIEIRIWPGFYQELPYRSATQQNGDPYPPKDIDGDGDGDGDYFSHEYHRAYPNAENLIAVVGEKNVTLRGVTNGPGGPGDVVDADRDDVVIDVEFKKHVGIYGDRSDGLIVENLSVYHSFDHGIYVMDQSGFLIDNTLTAYNRDYGVLAFSVDHGKISNCEALGAGDAGIYPGGTANTPGRHSVEVANCKSHHNVLGYSGTQGNYVWVHDTEFYDNAIGMTSDSETDHPNYPEENLKLTNNKFYNNNFNVYSTSSDIKATVFDGFLMIPVGTGVFLASGNSNLVQDNEFYDNDRYGLWLASGQAIVLGPAAPIVDGGPFAPPFLSSDNRFLDNTMYGPCSDGPGVCANGADFAWDGLGANNCWSGNVRSAGGAPATSDHPLGLPSCETGPPATAPNAANMYAQASLVWVDTDGDGELDTPNCDLAGTCGNEWGPGPAPANSRNLPQGYVAPPMPGACGPNTC